MNNRSWVENTIFGIIILNIFVLAYVFLIPRAQFMVRHWGWNAEKIMETPGTMDIPNQYSKTYKVANQILKIVVEDGIVFVSADNNELRVNKSVLIQRLYPRKVYFLGNPETEKTFSHVSSLSKGHMVFNKHSNLCIKQSVKFLEVDEMGICSIGE